MLMHLPHRGLLIPMLLYSALLAGCRSVAPTSTTQTDVMEWPLDNQSPEDVERQGSVAGAAAACYGGQWYPGIVHLHTQYSDGMKTPAELAVLVKAQLAKCRLDGKGFMIVTDHYDQIGRCHKQLTPWSLSQWLVADAAYPLGPDGPYGFEKYYRDVNSLCRDGQFAALAGAELVATWNPEPGNTAESHTLAVPLWESEMDPLTKLCQNSRDRQQEMIWEINDLQMLSIAAHPSYLLRSAKPKRVDYRYDIRPSDQVDSGLTNYRGLGGVEFWNVAAADQLQSDLDFYLRLLKEQHGCATAISGSNYHGILPSEEPRLNRVTWVYAEGVNGILEALEDGHTYASRFGVRLTELEPVPGVMADVDVAVLKASLDFASTNSTPKRMRIYRDGQLVHEEVVPAQVSTYSLGGGKGWSDDAAKPGEHWYVIELENVLVTSPLHVYVGTPQPFSSLLKAQIAWFGVEGRLQDRWQRLPERDQERPIFEQWQQDLSGDGQSETISVGFSSGGGSSNHEPVRIMHPKRGQVFSETFGDGGSLLLTDLDAARPCRELVTVKYIWGDQTSKEAREERGLTQKLAERGIEFDDQGVTDPNDDLFECHMCFHRYEVKVYGWTADGRCMLFDTFRTARKYPLYFDRYVLWEFSTYWSSRTKAR